MAKPSSNQNDHSGLGNRSLKSRQFKGVRMRKWGKWVSEIRMPNSRDRIWLGSYDTPEKAARAFDFAVYCLRGSKADFNFPYSFPDIPDASSLSPQQIQAAAAKFAVEEMWLPSEGNTADIPYPSSLSPLQIQAAAAKFAAEEIWLPSEDNAVDIPYASSPCPPQIQAAAAKFPAEEFWLPSEDHAMSSYYCSKAESGVEGQEISVKQGPTFWDSVLEDLDGNDSVSLEDFSVLDVYMEDYGFLFQPNEKCGPGAF